MSLGTSIRNSAQWLLAGNVAGQAVQFALGIVLARLLLPSDFGMVVTTATFTGLATLLAAGGTGEALIQSKEATARHYDTVFTIQLASGAMIYLFFFLIAPWFSIWFHDPMYEPLLRISAISFLFRPLGNLPRVQLSRAMRFKVLSLIGLISLLLTGIASVTMAYLGMGPWALVLSALMVSPLNIAMLRRTTDWVPHLHFDRTIAANLGTFGVKFSAVEIFGYFRREAANFVISRVQGPQLVGLYNKGDSLSKTPYKVMTSVYQPLFRALATAQDDDDLSRYLYHRTVSLLVVYTLPVYVGLSWLAEPLIRVLYGQKWIPSAEPLSILALCGLFYCMGNPAGAVLASRNRLDRELVVTIVSMVLAMVGTVVGLRWGLSGVSWGIFLTHLYAALHISVIVNQTIGTTWRQLVAAVLPGLGLTSLMVASLIGVRFLLDPGTAESAPVVYILVSAFTGALVYGLAFLLLPITSLQSESARWRRILRLSSA